MSYSYGEDNVGIDVVPTFQAINLIHPHVARVIQEMWADDEGICIAGGDFLTVFFYSNDIIHLNLLFRLYGILHGSDYVL